MTLYFAFGLGGLLIGILATLIFQRLVTKRGVMLIDHSDPEKDICRIDLNGQLTDHTKRFVLKVDHNAKLSQE